jgi:hypothetical protein
VLIALWERGGSIEKALCPTHPLVSPQLIQNPFLMLQGTRRGEDVELLTSIDQDLLGLEEGVQHVRAMLQTHGHDAAVSWSSSSD